MKAEKTLFRDENRIKIELPYSKESASVIQQIAGAKWSQTIHAWHIHYTNEAFRQLKRLFPEVKYEKKKQETHAGQIITAHGPSSVSQDVTLRVTEKRTILKLPLLKPYSLVFHLHNISNKGYPHKPQP